MSEAVDPALIRGTSAAGGRRQKVPTTLRFHVASRLAGGVRLNGRLYVVRTVGRVRRRPRHGDRGLRRADARPARGSPLPALCVRGDARRPRGQTVDVKATYPGNNLLGSSHAKALHVRR